MPTIEPQDDFDALLSRHLHAQLDCQLGKANAAFRQAIHRQASSHAYWLKRGWALAAGMAAAAAIALAIFLSNRANRPQHATTQLNPPAINIAVNACEPQFRIDRVIPSGFSDGEIITLPDGTAVRPVLQHYLWQTRIYDPGAKTVLDNIRRQERVLLVGVNYY